MESDEELETGSGAATPPGDNLCNDFAQGLAAAFGGLAEARGDRVEIDDTAFLGDGGSASLFGNVTVVRRPMDESEWPELAARMRAFYGGRTGGSGTSRSSASPCGPATGEPRPPHLMKFRRRRDAETS